MHPELLFVYGTLRRGAGSRMHGLVARSGTFVGMATFQGLLYRIGTYPGAVASANPRHTVLGEVYRLRAPDFVFRRLDRYEGCAPGFGQDPEYARTRCILTLASGEAVQAWIYLYIHPTEGLPPIPSGDFLDRSAQAPRLCPPYRTSSTEQPMRSSARRPASCCASARSAPSTISDAPSRAAVRQTPSSPPPGRAISRARKRPPRAG